MYLADIEYYRATGETFTGFDWPFFWYGPSPTEYDALLKQIGAEDSFANGSPQE